MRSPRRDSSSTAALTTSSGVAKNSSRIFAQSKSHSRQQIDFSDPDWKSSSSTHNPENPQGRRHHRLQPHFNRKPTNPEYPQPKSDVRSVLLDPTTGALSGLRPGGILVDMTTSEPSLAVEISSLAVDSIFAHKSVVGIFIKGAL